MVLNTARLFGSGMGYLNAWLPNASHCSFKLILLRTTAKSTEPDVSMGDRDVPIQSEMVLNSRHSLLKSVTLPWRPPREPRHGTTPHQEMLPARSQWFRKQWAEAGLIQPEWPLERGPFQGRITGGYTIACTELYECQVYPVQVPDYACPISAAMSVPNSERAFTNLPCPSLSAPSSHCFWDTRFTGPAPWQSSRQERRHVALHRAVCERLPGDRYRKLPTGNS